MTMRMNREMFQRIFEAWDNLTADAEGTGENPEHWPREEIEDALIDRLPGVVAEDIYEFIDSYIGTKE